MEFGERDYTSSVLALRNCSDYASRAKKPRRKSRYRDITVSVPYYEQCYPAFYKNGECILTQLWIRSAGLLEVFYRWHLLITDNVEYKCEEPRVVHTNVTYRVHDKYNIRKILNKKIKSRMPLFL